MEVGIKKIPALAFITAKLKLACYKLLNAKLGIFSL